MVGIVILNYNGAQTTIDCIESVVRYNTYPAKYVVVDNASKDDSVEVLSKYMGDTFREEYSFGVSSPVLRKYTLVVTERNEGYARGNNHALKYLGSDPEIDHVMILNSDVLFTSDIIPGLMASLERTEDVGIVSPLLYARDGEAIDYNCARRNMSNADIIRIFLLQYHDYRGCISKSRNATKILLGDPSLLKEEKVQIDLPSGSCMLVRKDVFMEIGWFDPNTFLYYEENILYRKLKKLGKRNYLCPGLSCIHLGAQSTSKNPVPFLKLKEAESAEYYLKNYGDMSIPELMLSFAAFRLFHARMWLASVKRWISGK